MPTSLRYDPSRRVTYVTITDPFTRRDLEQVMHDLTHAEDHPPDTDAIWDGRAVDFSPIDRRFAEEMVAMIEGYPARSGARVAFVVGDDLGYGMARMFESLATGILRDSLVCRTLAEAEAWLAAK